MPRDDNYPDDIRQYDNDPRSPFYEDPDEWMEEKADELADDWYREFTISGRIDYLDWDTAEVKFLMAGHSVDAFTLIRNEAHKTVRAYPEDYLPEPDYEGMT